MKNIRIGKDIAARWPITTNGEPELLDGRDLRLFIKPQYSIAKEIDFSTDGNVVQFSFLGIKQQMLGVYGLTLWENYGKEGQTVVDYCDAFELVPNTCAEERGAQDGLDIETVDLEASNIEVGIAGPPGPPGPAGPGVPDGGDPGQVLTQTEEGPAWSDLPDAGAVVIDLQAADYKVAALAVVAQLAAGEFPSVRIVDADGSHLVGNIKKTSTGYLFSTDDLAGAIGDGAATLQQRRFSVNAKTGAVTLKQAELLPTVVTSEGLDIALDTSAVRTDEPQALSQSKRTTARTNIEAVGYLALAATLGGEADGYPVTLTSTLAAVQSAYARFWDNPGRYRWSMTLRDGAAAAAFVEEAEASAVMTAEGLQLEFRSQRSGKRYGLLLVVEDGAVTSASVRDLPAEYLAATPSGDPMHYMYEIAGAVFHQETDTWSYRAPGFSDQDLPEVQNLTTDDVRSAYAYTFAQLCSGATTSMYAGNEKIAFVFTPITSPPATGSGNYMFKRCASLRYACVHKITLSGCEDMFYKCSALQVAAVKVSASVNMQLMFADCVALIHAFVYGINKNVSFAQSADISSSSMLFTIRHSLSSNPIIITVAASAYDRLTEDLNVQAALAEHQNVSLAAAGASTAAAIFARVRAKSALPAEMRVEDGELIAPAGYYITQAAEVDDMQRLYFVRKTWNASDQFDTWRLASADERNEWQARLDTAAEIVE